MEIYKELVSYTCPSCDGFGFIGKTAYDDPNYQICPNCEGAGEVWEE